MSKVGVLLSKISPTVRLEECFKGWAAYEKNASPLNPDAKNGYLWPEVANAVVAITNGHNGPVCVSKVADGHFAAEMIYGEKSYICDVYPGSIRVGVYFENILTKKLEREAIKSLTNKTFIMAALLFYLEYALDGNSRGAYKNTLDEVRCSGITDETKPLVYELCDYVKAAIEQDIMVFADDSIDGTAIRQIPEGRVENGTLKGAVLCGSPNLLFGKGTSSSVEEENGFSAIEGNDLVTLGKLMSLKLFKEYRETHPREEWEKPFIPNPETDPVVADNALVMPEVISMAKHYVETANDIFPFANFAWRGSTGYGKSCGCRQMARLLGKPFCVMSCSDETLTSDFLTRHVPDSGKADKADTYLPTFEEIKADPISVYEQLTGEVDFSANEEKCLTAAYQKAAENQEIQIQIAKSLAEIERDVEYEAAEMECESVFDDEDADYEERAEARAREKMRKKAADKLYQTKMSALSKIKVNDGVQRYKLVESPYAKALHYGWLCEVQEASRIRKSGTLPGINEYSRAGAVVNMENGTSFLRHKDCLICFTDNVGFDSCRPIDPSSIRRWDELKMTGELDRDFILKRVRHNVPFEDDDLLNQMYDTWVQISEFCEKKQFTRGSCTVVELEKWVQLVKREGKDSARRNCITTVINKCSELPEEQKEILDAVTATCSLIAA